MSYDLQISRGTFLKNGKEMAKWQRNLLKVLFTAKINILTHSFQCTFSLPPENVRKP